jgi:hypothetical protein
MKKVRAKEVERTGDAAQAGVASRDAILGYGQMSVIIILAKIGLGIMLCQY